MRYLPRSRSIKLPHSVRMIKKLNDCIERDAIRWDCSKNWIMVTALGAFYGIEVINPFHLEKEEKKERKSAQVIPMRKRA